VLTYYLFTWHLERDVLERLEALLVVGVVEDECAIASRINVDYLIWIAEVIPTTQVLRE